MHLNSAEPLPILMPLYKWWELPYLYAGAKCYDLLAGSMSLGASRLLNRKKTEEEFPLLKLDGLVGSVMYATETWLTSLLSNVSDLCI
jgi:glycerol-3-phosphate dehydrogenase